MKKTIFTILVALLFAGVAPAQEKRGKFSPEKFRAELEGFIVREACLSPKEASKFFPLYDEMCKKQRTVFNKMRQSERSNPCNEADCRKVIKERDNLEIELKKIQQAYHNKLLGVLSAQKVFKALKAEDEFHRCMLRRSEGKHK